MVQAKGLEPSPASLRGKYAASYTTLVHGGGFQGSDLGAGEPPCYPIPPLFHYPQYPHPPALVNIIRSGNTYSMAVWYRRRESDPLG
jgi:hypothetical protein